MAQIESWFTQDLKKPVKVQMLNGNLFSQDNQGNLIGVKVYDDDEPASLAGTVSANIIRADGGTVAATGTLDGNKCIVVLPAAAYAVPGIETIVVKLTSSGVVTTLLAVVVTIYRSSTDTAVDPGTVMPSIQSLIQQINTAVSSIPADYSSLWTSLAPAFSTDATYVAGQHVTYNSKVWRFNTSHSGEWAAGDVSEVKLGNELTDLKSAINDLSDAIFTDTFLKLTKASDAFTVEVNHYANSYGKQELSGYNLCYFTAQKDFECYCDESTLQNGQALSIGIYNGEITQSGFVRQYRRGDNNLPTIDNKATINVGQIFAVSIYTPSSSPEDFGIYANYKNETLNNGVKLNTNQIDQVLNEINPKPEEIATAGYKPYQRLNKNSSIFTVENNTYATTGDKVSLSGYQLLYFTATTDFDFYFDENTLGETFALFFSVYNGSIASGNNVYCKRRDNNDLPSESNKAHISAGQILTISIYTPTSSPADFVGYANYESFLQLTNSVYLNQLQLDQVGSAASYKNYARNKKIAWFGDSISEMRQLPHITGDLLSATVYDCSFRGSCIGRTYSNYNEFSFSHLVTSIVAGDFSAQWTQLEAKEQEEGHAMPWLRENLTTLESLNFAEIDYVVLLQGTNDFGIPINAQEPYSSRVAEMKGLMDDAIGRLLTFAPQLKFYIFTPFYRGDITEDNYHNTIADYVSAEIEVAGKYAIPVYNLLTNSRICQQTRLTYLNSADLVHPNEYGDSYLAEVCAKYIGTH